MAAFATVEDVTILFRLLTPVETAKADALLPIVSDLLRVEAAKAGKDLDTMITADDTLATVAKSVTVDVVARALMTPTDDRGAMTTVTESALGYSAGGTFLAPGGGLFIKNSELARLGLKRQRMGGFDLCSEV